MNLNALPTHHAVLLVRGDRDTVGTNLFKELEKISPAHRFFNQTVLDIDTARSIVSWSKTPYHEEKIALISFHTAGIEAQNTMLKMLEEPMNNVRFIILTSNKKNLLPTVISRLHYYETSSETVVSSTLSHAEEFLKTKNTDRMKLSSITKLLKQEDEKGRKNREGVRYFILSLSEIFQKTLIDKPQNARYVAEILQTASYSSDPSTSLKALLEYLSLLLPQTLD